MEGGLILLQCGLLYWFLAWRHALSLRSCYPLGAAEGHSRTRFAVPVIFALAVEDWVRRISEPSDRR